MKKFNDALRQGSISFGCDFNTVAEVTRLWGLTATKLPYHNWFRIPGREDAICCLLSEKGGKGWENTPHRGLAVDECGWRQIVRIDEVNSDPERPVVDQTVWPGQKFLVASVTPSSAFAVCVAGDGSSPAADVRFVIPKRDLELGYFALLAFG